MILVSLMGKPHLGLYYAMPFIPYRTMRDKLLAYPVGAEMLTILVLAVIVGGLVHGKRLPKSGLYFTWFIFGCYLYLSMWLGTALNQAPAPVWLHDPNFVTWKDYMMIPLVFLAAGLVVQSRKEIRTVIIIIAISLMLVDRSSLLDSLSRSWAVFDENKRDPGPLEFGSNQLAAFLAQFGMFFWGFGRLMKRKKVKLICYGITTATVFATMFTFSRASYLALLVAVAVFGILKDRKLLLLLPVFLLTWKVIVPTAVIQRVQMTRTADGELEASAEERVELWENAKKSFYRNPIFGKGYATFQFGEHVDDLRDTHNWYVLVIVETGLIGALIAFILLVQMVSSSYRLFKRARDPLYSALGLGCLLAVVSCLVANCFGDRWTYLEINGLLWVLMASVARAYQLELAAPAVEPEHVEAPLELAPSMEWR
jgi:O-antigen ligase